MPEARQPVKRYYVVYSWPRAIVMARANRGGDRQIAGDMSVATAERIARLLNADEEATGG